MWQLIKGQEFKRNITIIWVNWLITLWYVQRIKGIDFWLIRNKIFLINQKYFSDPLKKIPDSDYQKVLDQKFSISDQKSGFLIKSHTLYFFSTFKSDFFLNFWRKIAAYTPAEKKSQIRKHFWFRKIAYTLV